MRLKDWTTIAEDIKTHYSDYHGFVVLHGTDTLVYEACFLSFMLEGLKKPVILTGCQIPIFELRSDTRENFITSLLLAGVYEVPEIMIYFASKRMRGNRRIKYSCNMLEAFSSPNYPVLAEAETNIKGWFYLLEIVTSSYVAILVNNNFIRKPDHDDFTVRTELSSNVTVLDLYPTITLETVNTLLF